MTVPPRLRRIVVTSRWLKHAVRLGAALIAAGYLAIALLPGALAEFVGAPALTAAQLVVPLAIGAVPLALALAALLTIARLFEAFERGFVLDPLAGRLLGRVGLLIGASAVAGIAARAAAGAYVSHAMGAGEVTIAIGAAEVMALGLGALLVVVGWAMRLAADVAEEQRQFV